MNKKRILFIRPTLGYGGADRVTLNLLLDYDRERFSCDIALMRAEGEFIEDLPDDVRVFSTNSKSLWHFWKPLAKIIKTKKYDVLYATCGGAAIPMMIAALLVKYKGISVVSERNILFPPNKSLWKRRLMLQLKSYLYSKATWVTAVSKGVKKECEEMLGLDPLKCKVVYNPIVNKNLLTLKDEPVTNAFFNSKQYIILAVGRFEPQKDYKTLLEMFQQVREQCNAGLLILGKGPLMRYYQGLASDMGLADHVYFAGFDKNPFKYMKQCSTYVLSSIHEGMPGVLVQAMACGAACVSTNCPTGPDEIIVHGENGLLSEVGDANGLAENVLSILNDGPLREKLGKKAQNSVEKFTMENGSNSYFEFLD